MNCRFLPLWLCSALLAGCASIGLQPVPPLVGTSGTFNGWTVRDAVAVRDDDGITLVFAYLGFDRHAWVDDARLTPEDLRLYLGNDEDYAPRLELRLDAAGRLLGHRFGYGHYGVAWREETGRAQTLTLHTLEPDRLAGSFRLDDDGDTAGIHFDLPLLAFGPIARPGSMLSEDGGEPGRLLFAKSRAVWEGDLDRLIGLMNPSERADAVGRLRFDPDDIVDYEPGDIERSGSSFFMLKQRMNTPYVERIIGGAVDGDTAWVDFVGSEGVIGHGAVTGTAVMMRDRRGRWSVDRFHTQDIPEDDGPELAAFHHDVGKKSRSVSGGSGGASTVSIGENVFINGVRVDAQTLQSTRVATKTE